jgi:hypothetical protein
MNFGLVPALPKEPTVCHWCGGDTSRLFHVFRGKDSSRLYCCTDHLKKGEERAATKKGRAFDVVG